MAIDVFLPTVVRQAITIDKSGSNVSGTLIPQKDPSGEENRGVKGQPSPTESFGELFVAASGAQASGVQKPTPPKSNAPTLATPPFAEYLEQEKNQKTNQTESETYQPLSPMTMQTMPPMISEFLNDIAKQHGVAPPSSQQLQTALRMTSDYRAPKPVIVDTKTAQPAIDQITINKPATVAPEVMMPETPLPQRMASQRMASQRMVSETIIVPPQISQRSVMQQPTPKQETPQQTDSQYKAGFDDLSEDIQKSALDYGRMLEALNRYSVNIQDHH